MSSLAGKRAMPLYAAYSASKFALVGLTQSLAHELGPHCITVNALCPGFIPTERATATADALREPGESIDHRIASMVQQREALSALGRIGGVDDVARVAAFLASDEAAYLTGLAVSISGGEFMA